MTITERPIERTKVRLSLQVDAHILQAAYAHIRQTGDCIEDFIEHAFLRESGRLIEEIEREPMTGRDASFLYKGKQIRFQVECHMPPRVWYAHRDCATGPVERLELEFIGIDTETDLAVYRVVGVK